MSAKVGKDDEVAKTVLSDKEITDKLWMVRPCQIYLDEFKECSSMGGRFHQRYLHGETKECWQWKQDYQNCLQYEKKKNLQHLVPILAHEEERRKQRLSASVGNNVWEYRTEPPEDWMKEIPAKLTQTLVGSKSDKPDEEAGDTKPKKDSMCVIS